LLFMSTQRPETQPTCEAAACPTDGGAPNSALDERSSELRGHAHRDGL
jgi:hypothetical protein